MLRIASSQRAALRQLAISQRIARANGLHSSAVANALQAFAMPAMSPTMTEGGIASWKKQEGDTFSAGDVLIEIETDKATMDVEAQEDGFLAKIIVQGGSKNVQVGSAIAVIGEEGDEVTDAEVEKIVKSAESQAASKESNQEEEAASTKEESKKTEEPKKEEPKKEEPKKEEPKKEESSKPAPSKSESSSQPKDRDIIFASPVAKRLASEKGIPLTALKGTGPNGRIIKEDVDNYKPSGGAAASGSSSPPAGTKLPPGSPAAKDMSVPASYTDIPVSNMRRIIGQRLTESKQSTPHYYTTIEIKMDRVNQLRELFNKAAAGAEKGKKDGVPSGMKLSVNDFILKACAIALKEVPEANSAWMGDIVRQYHKADICVAVATPTGLITPIVTDVGGKGLADISATVKTLATKARDGKLAPNEYQGGSFTVSNLGMFGIEHFTAIINPPQSCILAIGASEQKLVLDESSEKGFKAINVMKVTLSADHRIVDGAVGAKWLNAFRDALENPLSFLL